MQPTDKVALTYEQVQALGGVIKNNIGQARELTTDDYDYPDNNPTGVALWRLEPGIYRKKSAIVAYTGLLGGSNPTLAKDGIYIVSVKSDNTTVSMYYLSGTNSAPSMTVSEKNNNGEIMIDEAPLVTITDNLLSSATSSALSANQGRILNDKIQALDSSWIAYGSATTSALPSVTITAPANGMFVVDFTTGDNWGTGGSLVTVNIVTPTGLTRVFDQNAIWTGGDTIGRQGHAKGIYTGAVKGTSYTFSLTRNGSFGNNSAAHITAMYLPG